MLHSKLLCGNRNKAASKFILVLLNSIRAIRGSAHVARINQLGDALHAVLCTADCNLRRLLRAMLRLGLKAIALRPVFLVLTHFVYGKYSPANSSYRNFRFVRILG
jgi:hypothetical protein